MLLCLDFLHSTLTLVVYQVGFFFYAKPHLLQPPLPLLHRAVSAHCNRPCASHSCPHSPFSPLAGSLQKDLFETDLISHHCAAQSLSCGFQSPVQSGPGYLSNLTCGLPPPCTLHSSHAHVSLLAALGPPQAHSALCPLAPITWIPTWPRPQRRCSLNRELALSS